MATAAQQVDSAFNRANNYANSHSGQVSNFLSSLNTSIYQAPTFSLNWASLTAPSMPSMPAAPAMPAINFTMPSGQPGAFTEALPSLSISSFTELAPTLNIPAAPTLSYGVAPSIPAIGAVTVPDAPDVTMPALPTYLTLTPVAFGGVDLREDWLDKLETMPELQIVQPTPFSYALGPK